MSINLVLPFHIKKAFSNINSFKKQIDLLIIVSDSRAFKATNFSDVFFQDFLRSGIKVLHLFSKSDLSDVKMENSFDFKKSQNRKAISKLIYKVLELDKYAQQNYRPYFQVMVVGFPNTGKSTLINLLKGKKIAIVENMPGKTKKISKFPIGNNVWIYDTPGIFFPKKSTSLLFNHLFLINAVPYLIRDYSYILKQAYDYLIKHYRRAFSEIMGFDISENYFEFLNVMADKYKFKSRSGSLDIKRAEEKFLNIIRSGKIKLNWDRDV